jgi:hypothetical protein
MGMCMGMGIMGMGIMGMGIALYLLSCPHLYLLGLQRLQVLSAVCELLVELANLLLYLRAHISMHGAQS